ncbi:GIN domain-containing protein [Flavobacterium antarcticum]|uniref:GIN domain-containing protein n=1 Tax=Flavobacterium antarcticum TaxID=271155 RepID=UPI0003B727B4|nr:DUF2807 domain-containing protein [Flavobacterium antarcticum]
MNKLIIFTTLLVTGFLTAQVSENRAVANFSKLKVSSSIDVIYTISDNISVTVETDDAEKLKLVKTEVTDGTLILSIDTKDYKEKKNKGKKKNKNRSYLSFINGVEFQVLKITVSGPNLESVKTSSSADVKFQNTNTISNLEIAVSSSGSVSGNFECTNVIITASSSADLKGTITANSVQIESSSSSEVSLSGKAVKISVKASSSSTCNLKNLTVENAFVQASSSADAIVNATKLIEAKASSSGSISFYGNPANVSKDVSSSGSVIKK